MKNHDSEYISLKQAAEISGYSPDYVGQLIRQGKLPGKQIFSNISWVTTEDALRAYMDGKIKPSEEDGWLAAIRAKYAAPEEAARLTRILLWVSIVGVGVVVLFLAFFLALSVDHMLEQRAMETAYVP